MKKVAFLALSITMLVLILGCSDKSNPVNASGFKGYIYYSNGGEISRIRLSDQTEEDLFTNAAKPDITADGRIIAVESYPLERIIVTDLSGANRLSIIESEGYAGAIHKRYFDKPRISYNQEYIVYEGDDVHNPITYVVRVDDGSLVLTIGDYSARQPMIAPSWAPDGSIYVQGWISMNNGIYKVSSDFSTIERIDPNLSNVSAPSVSPDGTTVAFIRDGKLWTMGTDGSNPTQINTSINNFAMPTWSPDSKFVAVTSSGSIYIVNIDKLTITQIKNAFSAEGNQLCWRY